MAGALRAWDELEAGRNRAIVEWLGVLPGTWPSMSGRGRAAWRPRCSMLSGLRGRWSSPTARHELLAVARQRARRPGHHLVSVHVDLERQSLGDALDHRPVDLVHASSVVHHLDDELAAITDLAAVVRPGGRVAIVEGGLDNRFLPDDCGVGEPGLEQRLATAQDEWFWSEVRPAEATVRTGWGWNVLLAEAGLVDVSTRSFLLDLPPPLGDAARRVVRGVFERQLAGAASGSAVTTRRRWRACSTTTTPAASCAVPTCSCSAYAPSTRDCAT